MKRMIALALLALALAPHSSAAAARTIQVAGPFNPVVVEGSVRERQPGSNGPCIGTASVVNDYGPSGSLRGRAEETIRYEAHGACTQENVREHIHIVGAYTGDVCWEEAGREVCRQGTFDYVSEFFFEPDGAGHGTQVIKHGTGQLEGIHGILALAVTPDDGFSYTGTVRFSR